MARDVTGFTAARAVPRKLKRRAFSSMFRYPATDCIGLRASDLVEDNCVHRDPIRNP